MLNKGEYKDSKEVILLNPLRPDVAIWQQWVSFLRMLC